MAKRRQKTPAGSMFVTYEDDGSIFYKEGDVRRKAAVRADDIMRAYRNSSFVRDMTKRARDAYASRTVGVVVHADVNDSPRQDRQMSL
jgi:hypothetical protein